MLTFGTAIKVIAGFYIGCTGIVTQNTVAKDTYIVNLDCRSQDLRWHSITTEILAKYLETVKKEKK